MIRVQSRLAFRQSRIRLIRRGIGFRGRLNAVPYGPGVLGFDLERHLSRNPVHVLVAERTRRFQLHPLDARRSTHTRTLIGSAAHCGRGCLGRRGGGAENKKGNYRSSAGSRLNRQRRPVRLGGPRTAERSARVSGPRGTDQPVSRPHFHRDAVRPDLPSDMILPPDAVYGGPPFRCNVGTVKLEMQASLAMAICTSISFRYVQGVLWRRVATGFRGLEIQIRPDTRCLRCGRAADGNRRAHSSVTTPQATEASDCSGAPCDALLQRLQPHARRP